MENNHSHSIPCLYLNLLFLWIPAHFSRSVWFHLLWPLPATLSAPSLVLSSPQLHRDCRPTDTFHFHYYSRLKKPLSPCPPLSGVFTPQNLKPGWIQLSPFSTSVNSLKSWPCSLAWHSTGTIEPTSPLVHFPISEMTVFIPYSCIQSHPHHELDSISSLTYASLRKSEATRMKHPLLPTDLQTYPHYFQSQLLFLFVTNTDRTVLTQWLLGLLDPFSSGLLHVTLVFITVHPCNKLSLFRLIFISIKSCPCYILSNTPLTPRYLLASCLCTFLGNKVWKSSLCILYYLILPSPASWILSSHFLVLIQSSNQSKWTSLGEK